MSCNLREPAAEGEDTLAKYRRKNPASMVGLVQRYVNIFGETPVWPDQSVPS